LRINKQELRARKKKPLPAAAAAAVLLLSLLVIDDVCTNTEIALIAAAAGGARALIPIIRWPVAGAALRERVGSISLRMPIAR
jgi:hypothetical protein